MVQKGVVFLFTRASRKVGYDVFIRQTGTPEQR